MTVRAVTLIISVACLRLAGVEVGFAMLPPRSAPARGAFCSGGDNDDLSAMNRKSTNLAYRGLKHPAAGQRFWGSSRVG